MSTLTIPYGNGSVDCELPAVPRIISLGNRAVPALPHPRRSLREALDRQTGKPSLARMLSGQSEVTIVVSDGSLPMAYDRWLPWLVDEINHAGVPDAGISVYIASGPRPAPTEEEQKRIYGEDLCRRLRFLTHDPDAIERFSKIGRTDQGTVVAVDRRVLESPFLIVTGVVSYDPQFGYTGGPMQILPGVCARDSIEQHERTAWSSRTNQIAWRVEAGQLVGNPLSEDMQETCNMLRPDICVNVVLNEQREIAWFGAGDANYVYRIGAGFLDSVRRPRVSALADIAIIGSGGSGLDSTLYAASSALRNVMPVLNSGATVFWYARCSEGQGSGSFASWRTLSIDDCRRRLALKPCLEGITALAIKRIAAEHQVHLVSDLPEDEVRDWGFVPHRELSRSLSINLPARAESRQWLLAPHAHNLLPETPAAATTKHHAASLAGVR